MNETVQPGRSSLRCKDWRATRYPVLLPGDASDACRYCGCDISDHEGVAMGFYAGPLRQRRSFLGVRLVWCQKCADAKNTAQAVCYSAPGVIA